LISGCASAQDGLSGSETHRRATRSRVGIVCAR
jgi:hypothetical protein